MTLPPAGTQNSLEFAKNTAQNYAAQIKSRANDAVAVMAANSVTTQFVYNLLDALSGAIAALNSVKNVAGLDAYAQAQIPGYTTSMVADITATVNALQACLDWVTANFPKDGTNTWLLAEQLNADGTRTLRSFTSAQTAGLRTNLNALIATIG